MGFVLVVEDDRAERETLAGAIRECGHDVDAAGDGSAAITMLSKNTYDVIITDVILPGEEDGLKVLEAAKRHCPKAAVLVTSGHGNIDMAVRVMKQGAEDFLEKPCPIAKMEKIIERVLYSRGLENEVNYLRHEQQHIYHLANVVAISSQMQRILTVVSKVATSNSTVLISGETGTGKEIIAGAIHYNSQRRNRGLICVNCAALQENLLESELFGHERGAFTGAYKQRIGRFEQAHGSTLFLDEVGDMSASIQAKVLRVIEEREFERLGGSRTIKVDVRLLCATNRDLPYAVEQGDFRKDLYYRLNVVAIHIPPLRERREDVLPLAEYFLRKLGGERGRRGMTFSPGARQALRQHEWPGNVRELENAVERAVLMAESDVIEADDLTSGLGVEGDAGRAVPCQEAVSSEGLTLRDAERQMVINALERANWVQKDAASLLGVSKRVMHYKIQTFGITNPRWTKNR
ncbi:MAG: sigma-54 dependent transcriptional regulator [Pseudomonadota bacterium]